MKSVAVEMADSWSAVLLVQDHVMDDFVALMPLAVLFCAEKSPEAVNCASQMHAVWDVRYA